MDDLSRSGGGTKIEGYFDAPRWAKYFMRIWLAGAVLIGIPIFVRTALDITTGSHHMSGDLWVGLMVPPLLVLFGTVLPKFGRLLGKQDRKFILGHVQNMLAARIEGPESPGRGCSASRMTVVTSPLLQCRLCQVLFGVS